MLLGTWFLESVFVLILIGGMAPREGRRILLLDLELLLLRLKFLAWQVGGHE